MTVLDDAALIRAQPGRASGLATADGADRQVGSDAARLKSWRGASLMVLASLEIVGMRPSCQAVNPCQEISLDFCTLYKIKASAVVFSGDPTHHHVLAPAQAQGLPDRAQRSPRRPPCVRLGAGGAEPLPADGRSAMQA